MTAKAQAQVGGDARVVALSGFRTVPDCLFKLSTPEAIQEYATLARTLVESGRMTPERYRFLSSYAMQFDLITRNNTEGKPNRPAAFIQMDKVFAALKLDDIDEPIAAAQGSRANPYARSGFSSRRR